MSHSRQASELSTRTRGRAYTPDSFFDHDPPSLKKRPALSASISMPSWLTRNDSNKSNSNSTALRISEPMTFNSRTIRAPKPVTNSPPRVLGMGAQVVRTPSDALADFESHINNHQENVPRASTESSTSSSSKSALPVIPEKSFDLPLPLNLSARRSPRNSKSSPHLKQGHDAPTQPPKSALPPLPTFRPMSTFEVEPPLLTATSNSTTTPSRPTATSAQSSPATMSTLTPSPFIPVVVSPSPTGTNLLAANQILIAVETTSSTMSTTLSTLTATPSKLSEFVLEQIALSTRSSRAADSLAMSPPPSPKREVQGLPQRPESPWSAAFRQHREALTAECQDEDIRISIADSASQYSASPPPSPTPRSKTPSPAKSELPKPKTPLPLSLPSSRAKSSSPRSPKSQRMHIFLDRPSAPYQYIFAFLRSFASIRNSPNAIPQLPASLLNLPASSAVRMAALLEVREEAAFLGMAVLERACETEIHRRRGEHALKGLTLGKSLKRNMSVTSTANSSMVSLGDTMRTSTAVDHESQHTSEDVFSGIPSYHHPYSSCSTSAHGNGNKRSMILSVGEVMAERITPSPIRIPASSSTPSLAHLSYTSVASSAARASLQHSTSALPTQPRSAIPPSAWRSTSSDAIIPLSPPILPQSAPAKKTSHTPTHKRFPQSVDLPMSIDDLGIMVSSDLDEDLDLASPAWNPMGTLQRKYYEAALSPRPVSEGADAEMGFLRGDEDVKTTVKVPGLEARTKNRSRSQSASGNDRGRI